MNRLMSISCFLIVLCFCLICFQAVSHAALITFDFTAGITNSSGAFSGATGIFTGDALFEERAGGSSNPNTYIFTGSPFYFHADIPTAPIDSSRVLVEVADDSTAPFGDYVVIGNSSSDYIYSVSFVTGSNSVFSGTDIPDLSILNDFQNGLFTVFDLTNHDYVLQANITSHNFSTVPLPSAVWLLGSAFVGLVGVRKRIRKT